MSQTTTDAGVEDAPALLRDRSFHGLLVTQFLGAFNDNLFKQFVLLICVDIKLKTGTSFQEYALALFAIPFVLFSGLGGFLADRNSKSKIVVLCKVGEIAVMGAGLAVFFFSWSSMTAEIAALFAVLFMMSVQSAFFGPAKYGILPELFKNRDLPQANGLMQMTTFVAIIFGMAMAGLSKEWLGEDRLWVVSGICVAIAVVGTLTSTLIRYTKAAQPDLRFSKSAMGINRQTWSLLKTDSALLIVLIVSSVFWFIGGIVQPAVNDFGKIQMGLSDGRTSIMAACMGIGIAIGCVTGGKLSHERIDFRLVSRGAWGIVLSLMLMGILGWQSSNSRAAEAVVSSSQTADLEESPKDSTLADTAGTDVETKTSQPNESVEESSNLFTLMMPASMGEFLSRMILIGLGFSAGVFVVPLQVFLQTRPPKDQKGRMIGTMNLINWIGIVGSAILYLVFQLVQKNIGVSSANQPLLATSWLFPLLGLLMIPIALQFSKWMQKTNAV